MHDKLFARDQRERQLAAQGVPRFLWNPRSANWRFFKTKMGTVPWGTIEQRVSAVIVARNPRKQLMILGGDDAGIEFAYSIGYRIGTIPLLHDMQDEFRHVDQYPRMVVLHNILHRATDERVQRTRDLLLRFRNTIRIVVVETSEPYWFSVKRLGLKPDGCCRVRYRR